MLKVAPVVSPVKVGDILYHPAGFMRHHFYRVIERSSSGVVLHACSEEGALTTTIKQFFIRDHRLIAAVIWQKVI